jgi:hypothetical protein
MQLYATMQLMKLYATILQLYATNMQLYATMMVPQTYICTITYLLVLMGVGTTK